MIIKLLTKKSKKNIYIYIIKKSNFTFETFCLNVNRFSEPTITSRKTCQKSKNRKKKPGNKHIFKKIVEKCTIKFHN